MSDIERYEYAPITHPQIAQRTFMCKDDGDLVYDRDAHNAFHEKLDTLLAWHEATQAATLKPEKVTEPAPTRTPRTKVKEVE